MLRAFRVLIPAMVMLGCDSPEENGAVAPRDPQVAQALDDPLMTDPDLSSRNEGAAALTVEIDTGLPAVPVSPEAVAAAQAEANEIVGGAGRMLDVPPAAGVTPKVKDGSMAAHLAVLGGGRECAARFQRSAIWAARLPTELVVYPRGAVESAAGSDARGCKARVVRFTSPVPLDDLLAYYWTRTQRGGLSPMHRVSQGVHVLTGGKEGLAFDLRVERQGDLTMVRLATLES